MCPGEVSLSQDQNNIPGKDRENKEEKDNMRETMSKFLVLSPFTQFVIHDLVPMETGSEVQDSSSVVLEV